jgi:hypothetical protein
MVARVDLTYLVYASELVELGEPTDSSLLRFMSLLLPPLYLMMTCVYDSGWVWVVWLIADWVMTGVDDAFGLIVLHLQEMSCSH